MTSAARVATSVTGMAAGAASSEGLGARVAGVEDAGAGAPDGEDGAWAVASPGAGGPGVATSSNPARKIGHPRALRGVLGRAATAEPWS